jgi:hypothetical protein
VAFARAVDAVFPGGFAERHEDELVEVQSNSEAKSARDRDNGGETVGRPFAEPQNRCETGEAARFSEFPESGEGFAEVAAPDEIRHEKRTRAREEESDEEQSDRAWLSQRSRRTSILDMGF